MADPLRTGAIFKADIAALQSPRPRTFTVPQATGAYRPVPVTPMMSSAITEKFNAVYNMSPAPKLRTAPTSEMMPPPPPVQPVLAPPPPPPPVVQPAPPPLPAPPAAPEAPAAPAPYRFGHGRKFVDWWVIPRSVCCSS